MSLRLAVHLSAAMLASAQTPPTISKAFGAAQVFTGQNTTLTFTLTNPNNSLDFTGVSFTDTLPAGLVVATPNGLNGDCLGAVTATAGGNSMTLTGGKIPSNSACLIPVN